MAITLTNTINYSGMLHGRTDENTPFLNAVRANGKNGGRTLTNSMEFVLASGYSMLPPSQPNISETDSLTAPTPETTERDQEYNVTQIFQRSVDVSFLKQSNFNMLGGVNNANQQNNVPNELDWQISKRVEQINLDLNWTLLNGTYQYAKGSVTVAPMTRGLIPAIQTNRFDNAGAGLSKKTFNNVLMNAIKNGASPASMEIWCNPSMFPTLDEFFITLPGFNQPDTRTQGGVAISQILTHYGQHNVKWDMNIPVGKLLFLDMRQIAVAEMPVVAETGETIGSLVLTELGRKGASDPYQLYGQFGTDYGAEWHHAVLENVQEVS